ncbi:MFS transporter [Kitasatospora sp. NPDC051853]|uniref:MFS transporter n=1 Tax=Kitasatospora sp. NPDC051853 TaxID=3364058 RepID=UPI0037A4C0CE
MVPRAREARPSAGRSSSGAAATTALVLLFSAGYLPAYLLPTVVGRLVGSFGLTTPQAGAVGSALLLASASAGLLLAGRVRRSGPVRLARAGVGLLALGGTVAALSGDLPLLLAGCLLTGLGAGTATAVASTGIAATVDPQRGSALGLLTTSAVAAALFLALPRLGGGHGLPFAAVAGWALLAGLTTGRLADRPAVGPLPKGMEELGSPGSPVRSGLPRKAAGCVLAGGMLLWSMGQNALWGVSGQIGTARVGLDEQTLGLVFAAALGGGLLGVAVASAMGSRFGRALPIGAGTAVIALCMVLAGGAGSVLPFAVGEVLWNTCYPLVLSHLIALAAGLDRAGRWAVLAGAGSSLGVAAGPVAGAALASAAGYPGMGLALGGLLAVVGVPLVLVARRGAAPTAGRVFVPAQRSVPPGRATPSRGGAVPSEPVGAGR